MPQSAAQAAQWHSTATVVFFPTLPRMLCGAAVQRIDIYASTNLRVDCIHCMCSQECRNMPCLCLQKCIKVFRAFFVSGRRNVTGFPVLRVVSTEMEECEPGYVQGSCLFR